jgi:predicted O-methyltransferase YrrM
MSTPRNAPVFTADWFHNAKAAWLRYARPHLPTTPVNWLEVGSYEGLSTLWTLDHFLPAGSCVTCVDVFDDILSGVASWGKVGYADRFDHNTAGYDVLKLKGLSHVVLKELQSIDNKYQGAYVDGNHDAAVVAVDVRLVWGLLLPDSIMICDDYGEGAGWGTRSAIDAFRAEHPEVETLHSDYQIIMRKRP